MAKMNASKHIEKKVSINEFVLLITGIFDFDSFHKYTSLDLTYVGNELWLSQFNLVLLNKYVPSKATNHLKVHYANDFNHQIRVFLQQKKDVLRTTEGVASRLEKISQNEKNSIRELMVLISGQAKNHFDTFPCPLKYQEPQTKGKLAVFKFFELSKWIHESMDISDIPITPFVNAIFSLFEQEESQKSIPNNYKDDGYIKIDTLPKIMQFMIECYDDKSLQRTTIENRDDKKVDYIKAMHKKINPLAINKGIKYTDKNKTYNGLSKAAVEQMMFFIQEDKIN